MEKTLTCQICGKEVKNLAGHINRSKRHPSCSWEEYKEEYPNAKPYVNRENSKFFNLWSQEELKILKENYPKKGTNIPRLLEEGRTKAAIKNKARELGVRYKGSAIPSPTGKRTEGYGSSWNTQRKKALERDDYTCQNCGRTDNEGSRSLNIHHLILFWEFKDEERGNDMENLVTLCNRCHGKAHAGELDWLNEKEEQLREKWEMTERKTREGSGIPQDYTHWTEEEVQILREEFPQNGSEIPKLLNKGRTRHGITWKAEDLDLKYRGEGSEWSEEEEEIFQEKYPTNGSDIPELRERGKSRNAIRKHASAEEIKCHQRESCFDPWSKEEREILRREYPAKGTRIPKLLEKGRTRKAIRGKARELGISYENYHWKGEWSEEELKILREKYPEKGRNIQELIKRGRSKEAIASKAISEGIKYNGFKKWTEEEVKILREKYPKKGTHIQQLLEEGRTKKSIRLKAQQEGIKYKGEGSKWSEEELKILRKKYPDNGSNIPELLEGKRTKKSIREKAQLEGIKYKGTPNSKWTRKEIKLLRREYPHRGANIQELLEEGRTKQAIWSKADDLGIEYKGKKKQQSLKQYC